MPASPPSPNLATLAIGAALISTAASAFTLFSESSHAEYRPSHSQPAPLATTLASSNRSPLLQVLGLPTASDIGQFEYQLAADRKLDSKPSWWRLQVANFNLSSESTVRDASNTVRERILQDGEIFRLSLSSRWSTGKRSAFAATVPLIAHHPGNADQPIEQWHKIFGLPNSNRDRRAQNQLEYRYERDGEVQLAFRGSAAGIGDAQVEWLYLWDHQPAKAAQRLRLGAKLPTGSRSKLAGTGSCAIFGEYAAAGRFGDTANTRWQLAAGLTLFEGGGLLGDIRKSAIGSAHASIARSLSARWQAQAQLESHSTAYRSSTDELGQPGLQLSLGLGYQLGQRSSVAMFFTEDLITRSSPDIGIGLSFRYATTAQVR